MCFLLRLDEAAVVLDAGTGISRLIEPEIAAQLEGCEALDLVLTHFHLDHTIGISYLPALSPTRPVRIHAPGPPLVDSDPAEALCRLIHPPLFPIPLPEFPMAVDLVRMTAESHEIAGVPVRLRRQKHPGGSVGLRFADRLAYVTDTVADEGSADLAAGVDLLLHEVWAGPGGEAAGVGHSSADQVARIARSAGVARLMPVHLHPARTSADVEALGRELEERLAGEVEVVLPEEGRVYQIGELGA
jgi:ribonuclease BN (tRNA processing enzyme)